MTYDKSNGELEPLSPEEGLEMYLNQREDELASSSLQSHQYRIQMFTHWCGEQSIDNLNDLTGRLLFRYRIWRKEDGNLNKTSLKTQLSTVRAFVNFLETIDAVPEGLHRDVILPSLKHGEDVRDVSVSKEEADAILNYLQRFEYAEVRHVLFATLWETAIRTGTAYALDIEDVLFEEQALRIRHRQDTGTRLKNGQRAERLVAISDELCRFLEDYLQYKRPDTTDDFGRNPLFASNQGRMHKSNLRNTVYALTRPCHYSGECPHGREQSSKGCEAVRYEKAAKCPSSVSLHAIRRGGITWRLLEDAPKSVISDRADVSPEVLDKHYDVRSEKARMEQRRIALGLDGGDTLS